MKTLTKSDLATRIIEQTSIHKMSMAMGAVDAIVDIHKAALFARKAVYFPKCGRIAVYLKAPRMGRNPKTGVEHLITERHSITFTAKKTEGTGKLNKTSLTEALCKHGYSRRDAEDLANIWYTFVREVLTGNTRIEFRGFGVIYPKILKAGMRTRNPKTGESLISTGGVIPAFRCAPALRRAIDKQYL